MSTEESTQQPIASAHTEDPDAGIDIFDIVVAILSEWRLGVITFAIVAVLGTVGLLTLKPQFVATSVFLPQAGRSDNSFASLFSSRGGPGTLYIGLLQSRGVQDDVVESAKLLDAYHLTSMEEARDRLNGQSSFTEGGNSLVTISIRDGDAKQAAKIANSYLDALDKLNEAMAYQQSSQTTEFFERQLEHERGQLAIAESQLAETQKSTGLVASDAQTQIGLSAIAGVRADIASLQVQLAALLQSETDQNPQVQTLRSQIAQLEAEQRHMTESSGTSPVGAALPAGQMPQTNLNLARAQREVKYHDALVTSLANQFEAARLNQAFSRSAFQVVDRAVVPERKAWPPRKPFFAAILGFAALIGLCAIIARLAWKRITATPSHRVQMAQLRRAFGSS